MPTREGLDEALEQAGIERRAVYLTNVVKHFKCRQGRGKRRLHQRPNAEEIRACGPWLDAELAVVRPRALICLGATAAKAPLGPKVRVMRDRGRPLESELAPLVSVTGHPSAILRVDDPEEQKLARAELARDLAAVARALDRL